MRGAIVRARGGTLIAAALLLAGCGTTHGGSTSSPPHATPIATTSLNPGSICSPDEGDYVSQKFNGDYTGCFRVPNLRSKRLIVALSAFFESTSPRSTTTTTLTEPVARATVSLTSSTKRVTPGQVITLTGHVSQPVSRQTLPLLCWDGCSALQEQGQPIHWLSSRRFRINFRVPKTAWLVNRHSTLSVHPLTSGTYEIGVACLTSISGCALGPAQAQTSVELNAPSPRQCVRSRRCETMTLSTTKASVGDEVKVSGWAPVQDIIGRPFNYSLSVTPGPVRKSYPALAYAPGKSGSLLAVVAPTVLSVTQGSTWSELGRVAYRSSTYSGPSSVDPATNSSRVGWCEPSDIVITGGTTPQRVPVSGVGTALRGSSLRLFTYATGTNQCSEVQLDPRYPASVYAAFNAEQGNSAPPVYSAPLYTTNAGQSWRQVPVPPGSSVENFGGFINQGDQIAALFSATGAQSRAYPLSTKQGYVVAEVTANGGQSWSGTTLGCPSSGPCVVFGPTQTNNCNMSNDNQPLLVGPSSVRPTSKVRWQYSTWVSTVDSCFTQQLVVSSSRVLFLVDPSSEYPLLRSTNAGRTWSNEELPPIPGENYAPDSAPRTNSLVMAPNGSLFASLTTPTGKRQELFRLSPGARAWCPVPGVFTANLQKSQVGSLRVNATSLMWNQSSPPSFHTESFSKLTCPSP